MIDKYTERKAEGTVELTRKADKTIEIKEINIVTETIKYDESKVYQFNLDEFRAFVQTKRDQLADYEAQLVDMEALP